jgi:hypothetical protein
MSRPLRYGLAVVVGLSVTAVVATASTTDRLVIVSLPILYGAVTAIGWAHRGQLYDNARTSGDRDSSAKLGGIIGGVGALTGSLLLQASIPAGAAAYGLMFLGVVGTVADYDTTVA